MLTWPLLASLDEADRRRVMSQSRRRSFRRGEVVFHEGDPGNVLHLVERGHFSVRITTPLGDIVTVRIHGPGSFFGEMAVFSPAPRSATVLAIDKGETLSLSHAAIAELRTQDGAIDRLLLEAMIGEVRRLSGALADALYTPADRRIHRRLRELHDVFEGGPIPVTQEALAQLAGTTRPTANRVLRSLEERGIVVIARGRIEVSDLDGLGRAAR